MELQKSNSLFEKQKEIMEMMESKQRDMKEELKDMRVQLKQNEQTIEELRRSCRAVEDEKMGLMVANLTHEREVAQLREQVQLVVGRTYDKLVRTFQQVLLVDEARREKRDSQSESQGKGLFANRFSLSEKQRNEDFSLDMNEPLRENVSLDLSCSFQ